MKIRDIDLGARPVLLAPMESVSDIGFRTLCRRLGASMVYSEFVAADALVRYVAGSMKKLRIAPDERPVAIQIYGKDPVAVADAADIVVETAHPDVLDLNFGCPVKRVAGKGAGAGLLQNVPLLLSIADAVVQRVGRRVPVTAKTRLGWDSHSLIIPTLSEQLQDVGIEALTIHGRTRAQMYEGRADWTLIGEVKRNPRLHIPIIGNGDISSGADAVHAFDTYGVDAIMVGRATFGQPWIFRDIREALDATAPTALTIDERLDILREQIHESVTRIDEYRGILHVRRHLAASSLFKGIPNFRPTRIAMLRATTVAELEDILRTIRPLIQSAATMA